MSLESNSACVLKFRKDSFIPLVWVEGEDAAKKLFATEKSQQEISRACAVGLPMATALGQLSYPPF